MLLLSSLLMLICMYIILSTYLRTTTKCVFVCVSRALKALWQYLGARGVNTTLIWEKIKDIVIKTIIA